MKTKTILFVLLASLGVGQRTQANAAEAVIDWRGNGGYRAQITMSYGDSWATVVARGDRSFSGLPINQGVTELSVAFYTPSSLQPVFSTQDVASGIITYRFLTINFGPLSRTLSGDIDVGRDTFAEGGPGSSAGQFYLHGLSVPNLVDSSTGQPVDSGGQFTVRAVPESSTLSLGAAGLATIIASGWRNRPAKGA